MRLKNATDIPSDLIREIIRFVKPPGIKKFDVRVGNTRDHFKGRAYSKGSAYHSTADPFVNVYVGPVQKFPSIPYQPASSKYLPTPYMASRVEALVFVMAHELRHLWQSRVPRGRRVWGARGQFSERDADAYAIRMLREWRRTTNSGVKA